MWCWSVLLLAVTGLAVMLMRPPAACPAEVVELLQLNRSSASRSTVTLDWHELARSPCLLAWLMVGDLRYATLVRGSWCILAAAVLSLCTGVGVALGVGASMADQPALAATQATDSWAARAGVLVAACMVVAESAVLVAALATWGRRTLGLLRARVDDLQSAPEARVTYPASARARSARDKR